MNERIKEFAEQAYALCGKHNNDYNGPAFTEAFAALVEAQEREACAKVCEDMKGQCWAYDHDHIAAAIRARGTT